MPTTFLRLIGIDNIPETVHAQACSPCGAVPLDVMIVLDRTGSMTGSKLDSAKQGVLAFMRTMDPTTDNVGLAVLPPAPTSAAACNATATNAYDSPSAAYVLVPLNDDYAIDRRQPQLRQRADLHDQLRPGRRPDRLCQRPRGSPGRDRCRRSRRHPEESSSSSPTERPTKGPGYLPPTSPYRTNPCQTAVDIAGDSKSKGVLMYSIAYDVSGATAPRPALPTEARSSTV